MSSKTLFAVLLAVAPLGAFAAEPVYFANVGVFDGTKSIPATHVLIVDGKIQSIGDQAQPVAEAAIVDGTGKTLLPGLIDCHTHTFAEHQLKDAADFGVTTELDMMSVPRMAAALRQQQSDGNADDRADFFSAGAAVTVAGGHGTQFGFPVPTIDRVESAGQFVADRVAEGSDYIKLIYDDGSAYGNRWPTLSKAMFAAAVAAAHERGKLAVAHVSAAEGATLALDSDIDGLVHLFCDREVTDPMAERLKASGIFVVPTAVIVSNASGSNLTESIIRDPHLRPLLTREEKSGLERTFPSRPGRKANWQTLKFNIAKLNRIGVPILAGSDAPNPGTAHGVSMHHELRLLVESGLSPSQALAAATSLPAQHFNLSDRGRIAVGMRGDVLLVEGDPTRDITHVSRIAGVWKAGHKIDRQPRLAKVSRQSQQAAKPGPSADKLRLISDFEGQTLTTEFGFGWADSTDSIMGGDSTVSKKIVDGGAGGSERSLQVAGRTRTQQPAFAGIMFSPGEAPMQPTDLSAHPTISFWAKGDGQTREIMLFTRKGGFRPSVQSFQPGEAWKQYRFQLSDFDNSDGTDVMAVWFGSSAPGEFQFQIDQVRLEKP